MHTFRRCVQRYKGNHHAKRFSCLDQFLCMAFAQLTYRESLRDIEAYLRAQQKKLYHMGIRARISRSTLAEANVKRDWRIYADFAQLLIGTARQLYINDDFGVELDETVYALDSTTIDLSLTMFPWAHFRQTKAAIKLHTLLAINGKALQLLGYLQRLEYIVFSSFETKSLICSITGILELVIGKLNLFNIRLSLFSLILS